MLWMKAAAEDLMCETILAHVWMQTLSMQILFELCYVRFFIITSISHTKLLFCGLKHNFLIFVYVQMDDQEHALICGQSIRI